MLLVLQQLFLELEHMASRPFAGLVVELEREPPVESEDEPFLLFKGNNPTPIALEPCSAGKAAILSLIIRLPTGGTGAVPPGQTGLAVASALVSLGTLDQKSSKDMGELVSGNSKGTNSTKSCISPHAATGL